MWVENTHLWNDYHNGCEEENWQDQDPFDMDKQDNYGIFIDDDNMEDFYSGNYRSNLF